MKKTSDGLKKQRRYKPGTVALREIRKMQRSTDLLMAKRPFQRLVRQVIREMAPAGIDMRIERKALQALQEASEAYLVEVLQATNKAALHRRRVTIAPLDVRFAMDMRGDDMIAVAKWSLRDVGLKDATRKKSSEKTTEKSTEKSTVKSTVKSSESESIESESSEKSSEKSTKKSTVKSSESESTEKSSETSTEKSSESESSEKSTEKSTESEDAVIDMQTEAIVETDSEPVVGAS